ncbi:MAG: glycosyltransferase, partial [Bacteroidota bacterium]
MNERLRVLILADINSPHTQKWVMGLSENNIEIAIFSFNAADTNWYKQLANVHCLRQAKKRQKNSWWSKLEYLLLLPQLIISIRRFKPNIVHAQYASSYGFLAALSFFKPLVVSVWGSDVMQFPKKGHLQKWILNLVFFRAKKICATSSILQREVSLYTKKPCEIVPFGIHLKYFYSFSDIKHPTVFTIGCIK